MVPPAGAALQGKLVPLNSMRGTIAKRLVESKSTIPHYQVTVSARVDKLMELREQLNEQLESQGVKLSVNDFLVRACALAMHQHPYINSSWVEKGPAIQLHAHVNIGVAVSLPEERGGGLVVATIRGADQTGLRQISAETKRLAKKARDKGLTIEEMSDSTFTISNLGMFGVDHFTAIINPPNAAILAVGRAVEKPFVEHDDEGEPYLVVGHEMSMTMSSDHRIIDGAMAAQYLSTVKELLENPAALLV
jgi:pyruvate dehydrogenase E2 component (dihydrolipoamide acetyltransferase)